MTKRIKKGDTAYIVKQWNDWTVTVREVEVLANGKQLLRAICQASNAPMKVNHYHSDSHSGVYATVSEATVAATQQADEWYTSHIAAYKRRIENNNSYHEGYVRCQEESLIKLSAKTPRVISWAEACEEIKAARMATN